MDTIRAQPKSQRLVAQPLLWLVVRKRETSTQNARGRRRSSGFGVGGPSQTELRGEWSRGGRARGTPSHRRLAQVTGVMDYCGAATTRATRFVRDLPRHNRCSAGGPSHFGWLFPRRFLRLEETLTYFIAKIVDCRVCSLVIVVWVSSSRMSMQNRRLDRMLIHFRHFGVVLIVALSR